ncbi:MAG TPA: transketolase C-terminal domain-containing protein [Chloroflexota bacterium]|nr:transketolase C-terminal domain-containing protein [Chloroflexota bacterium]
MTSAAATTNDWRTKSQSQTRLAYGQALLALAAQDPDVVVLSADTQDLLGIREYIELYTERFVEVGIAEQNKIGISAGLATVGLKPYVCAYAPFISARGLEQIRNDLAYAHQNVVVGAAASGISLGVSGGTHHAVEDLATMRSFAGMTVIVPADVSEAYKATLYTLELDDGPVYIRLGGRTPEPDITDPDAPFTFGKATELRPGNDVAIIACGATVEMAVKASDALKAEGVSARVLNMSTIKPLDTDAILKAAEETRGIVTAEEHHVTGGLGGAVAEFLVQTRPTKMRLVGLGDEFAVVGPTVPLRARYGMSAENIAAKAKELL